MEAIWVVVLQVVVEAAGLNNWVVRLLESKGQVSGRAPGWHGEKAEFLTEFGFMIGTCAYDALSYEV